MRTYPVTRKDGRVVRVTVPEDEHRTAAAEADRVRAVKQIAREHLGIADLTERHRDRLDFHEVHVNGVRAALEAAYRLGVQHAEEK